MNELTDKSILHFEGYIKDVQYKAFLTKELFPYPVETFNVNASKAYGKIILPDGEVSYSKWVSPKRTRTYPFERLYNIFNSPMRITIIPVIKDEGADGDLDKIQYSTISWMNLLNIYIILAYYDHASKNMRSLQVNKQKLTNHKYNESIVREQLLKISHYKQSALHWNRSLIENDFYSTYQKAVNSYELISLKSGVRIHDPKIQEHYLTTVFKDFQKFRDISLHNSKSASKRESRTEHILEYLSDGVKATIEIINYLGGVYYLTVDEVVMDENGDSIIIQESKNSSKGFIPSLSDIKDGLFKLILFSNLDHLKLNSVAMEYKTRLKLTGKKVNGKLEMPCEERTLNDFLEENKNNCSLTEENVIRKLNMETGYNARLYIQITSNAL